MPLTFPSRAAGLVTGGVAAAGAACVAYGVLVERDWYRLRRETVPALEPGRPPLTVTARGLPLKLPAPPACRP